MNVCDSSTDARFQVKCIGTLECLAQYPDSIEANRVRYFVHLPSSVVPIYFFAGDIQLFIINIADCVHAIH